MKTEDRLWSTSRGSRNFHVKTLSAVGGEGLDRETVADKGREGLVELVATILVVHSDTLMIALVVGLDLRTVGKKED